MHRGWFILIVLTVLVGCGKTQPQRPSFLGQASGDTTSVQLLLLNQQMASQADLQLAHVATADFVLMEGNYWVRGLYPQEDGAPMLQEGEYIDLNVEFYTLKGELLSSHQASVRMGQVDEIQAIALVLPYMQHGEQITMLVPWYMAFGSAGNHEVPAYENLRIELQMK